MSLHFIQLTMLKLYFHTWKSVWTIFGVAEYKWTTLTYFYICVNRKIIMNPNLLASLEYYSRARHTSSVENFFSHTLLHYAPKRIQFSYDGYCIRYIQYFWFVSNQAVTTKVQCKHVQLIPFYVTNTFMNVFVCFQIPIFVFISD